MKTSILTQTSLLALGLVGLPAMADIHLPVEFGMGPQRNKAPLEFNAGVGYMTKHFSRDMAFQSHKSDQAMPFELLGAYKLDEKRAIIAGLKYEWLLRNGIRHDHVGICDEGTAIIGYKRAWRDNLHSMIAYQFVHGNIGGSFNIHEQGSHKDRLAFDHVMPEEHSVVMDTWYGFGSDIGMDGFYAKSRVQYTFQWMTGWWFQAQIGYKHDWDEKLSTNVYYSWNVTANYFEAASRNTNGTQGYSFNVEMPYKVRENVTLTPFVSFIWSGRGAKSANDSHNSVAWHHPQEFVFRNFTVVGGINLTYHF